MTNYLKPGDPIPACSMASVAHGRVVFNDESSRAPTQFDGENESVTYRSAEWNEQGTLLFLRARDGSYGEYPAHAVLCVVREQRRVQREHSWDEPKSGYAGRVEALIDAKWGTYCETCNTVRGVEAPAR